LAAYRKGTAAAAASFQAAVAEGVAENGKAAAAQVEELIERKRPSVSEGHIK